MAVPSLTPTLASYMPCGRLSRRRWDARGSGSTDPWVVCEPLPLALTPRPRPAQVTREEAERRILAQDEPYKLEP